VSGSSKVGGDFAKRSGGEVARIILNTFGSFGDLHPYLAVAIALRNRGHDPIIATAEIYRAKVKAEQIDFAPVRPNVGELINQPEFVEKLWHPSRGSEYLLKDYVLPQVEDSYSDLIDVCRGADLILTHTAAYAGPVAAEVSHVPWLSVALQPTIFFSRCDPPVLPPVLWLRHFYRFGRLPFAALFALGRHHVHSWVEPVRRLRRRVGLPPSEANPMFEGQFSPYGTLALFSKHFARPQPDWPPKVTVTGFVFYDRLGAGFEKVSEDAEGIDSKLPRFLDEGPAPVLFTLGSSAVMQAGSFYAESLAAAERLGVRAVLLGGRAFADDKIVGATYVPYSQIMPRTAAIVHQGGIGTTAQALRAGRPMLVVPWAHDQPDNAERVRKLGVARVVSRGHYTSNSAARELSKLLRDGRYQDRATETGKKIAVEDGVSAACEAIEGVL
jgi:rhamnosyltransferase subunit B